MKIFISWSGQRSLAVAEALRDWIPGIVNAAEPWLSATDLEPGARWNPDLARQLDEIRFGVICLTPENLDAPWIYFEAGALSKTLSDSRVVPYLFDLSVANLVGPLTQFQALVANEDGTKRLIHAINDTVRAAGEKGVDESLLDRSFALWWPTLAQHLAHVPEPQNEPVRERTERELLEEILSLARTLARGQQTETGELDRSLQELFTDAVALYMRVQVGPSDEAMFRTGGRFLEPPVSPTYRDHVLRAVAQWRRSLEQLERRYEAPEPGSEDSTASQPIG